MDRTAYIICDDLVLHFGKEYKFMSKKLFLK